jgi:hypothetical protein
MFGFALILDFSNVKTKSASVECVVTQPTLARNARVGHPFGRNVGEENVGAPTIQVKLE